jgi:very-short-patch-repair endonuclease
VSLPQRVLVHFMRHHGVATTAELRDLGLSARQIDHLLRSGRCESGGRGIYVLAGTPRSLETLAAIACGTATHVLISHQSAGTFWGYRKCQNDQLQVMCRDQTAPAIPNARIHRSHRLDVQDIVVRDDGIRLTSPVRTLFDLAKVISDEAVESVIEQALRMQLVEVGDLFEIAERLRQKGRNGSARFGRVLGDRPAGLKPVDSDLELRVERALLAAGLPRPSRQHEFELPPGGRIRVDFYWPEHQLVLEVDHAEWHSSRVASEVDKWRDRQLQLLGISTVRVTDSDVAERLNSAIADVAAIIRARSSAT